MPKTIIIALGLFFLITSLFSSTGHAFKYQGAWLKLCERLKGPGAGKYAGRRVCLTHYEQLNMRTGLIIYSAAVREIEKHASNQFMIMLPKNVDLARGVTASFSNSYSVKIPYSICTPGGCTAEIKVSPSLQRALKKSQSITLRARMYKGRAFKHTVSLKGFNKALNGRPLSNELYLQARREFLKRIKRK